MHGVVSLLDEKATQAVGALWTELADEFGVRGVSVTPFPHFSYHVAEDYDLDRLLPILQRFAEAARPFRVRTTGLGIFTGEDPVLYIPVARSVELAQLHDPFWHDISNASSGTLGYYRPDQWMPHITLARHDLSVGRLAEIVDTLGGRDFTWDILVDNVALIYDDGVRQTVHTRFSLGGV